MSHTRQKQPPLSSAFLKLVQAHARSGRGRLFTYLFVVALMGLALVIRLAIAPIDGGIQYITFFPSVAIAAVIGGFGAGMFAACIGIVMASYLFWPPYMSWALHLERGMLLSNAVFFIDALLVCTSIEAMHRFYRRFQGAEEELRSAAAVYEHASEGIMVTDPATRILTVNPAFTRMTGFSAEELIGETPAILQSDMHSDMFYYDITNTLFEKGAWQGQIWNRRKNGEAYLQWTTINKASDPFGDSVRYVAVCRDITDSHSNEEKIRYLAFYDALTNLPNRLILEERLERAIGRARRDNSRVAVLFIGLDRFRTVNETLGHAVGDRLLQDIARRIRHHIGVDDTAVRLSGDVFVVLTEGVAANEREPGRPADLITAIAQPLSLKGQTAQVTASIGVAVFPDDATNLETLFQHAEAAMFTAKRAGGATIRHAVPLDHGAAPPSEKEPSKANG
ncbi:diguanylate cyclase domain-containing protein [Roseospira marina]|nr:diguanylate cyclase [Roseospira marina]MBB4315352.1 diguanylate cyclase (GGDEF)-like protein/PAS domain S-box-containing protein [Roseospira marina]MBB5088351.1 diguanylate cyclase (GGDEF)-like protein/PAS domain S-box-containing protein [Roseospira marina]